VIYPCYSLVDHADGDRLSVTLIGATRRAAQSVEACMNKEPRIYGSKWDRERLVFLRAHPLCVMCQQQGRVAAATVVDHITPHKLKEALLSGDAAAISKAQKLFWSQKLAGTVQAAS
jgi:5-methylcytosine-specific restriction endonuclease McrA